MNKILKKFKQQIVLLVCCFSFMCIQAQPATLTENAEISVLTCGTGDEMYTLFGHTALRIKDIDQNLDVVYNWGMFDFRTPRSEERRVGKEGRSMCWREPTKKECGTCGGV